MAESDSPQSNSRSSTVIVVCIVIIMILVIAQMVVGLVYSNDCPRQPFIPVYLCGFVVACFLICKFCDFVACYGIMAVFFLCWFIAGSVTIYSIYEPNYSTTQHDLYCNKTLYLFAFSSTTLIYVLLGVIIFSWCCCCEPQEQDDDARVLLQG